MATAAYIEAAKAANRQPTVLMRVESADGKETFYTTKSDWQNSADINAVLYEDYNQTPFITTVVSDPFIVNVDIGTIKPKYRIFTSQDTALGISPELDKYSSFIADTNIAVAKIVSQRFLYEDAVGGGDKNTIVKIRTGSGAGPVIATSNNVLITYINLSGDIYSTPFLDFNFTFPTTVNLTSGVTYYLSYEVAGVSADIGALVTNGQQGGAGTRAWPGVFASGETTSDIYLETSTIDLGGAPSADVVFSVDDVKPSGSSIIYSAFGGNADPPTTDLGVISDGSSLAPYQYYRITSTFDQEEPNIDPNLWPSISEYVLTEGAFEDFGTHKDLPINGVRPSLMAKPVSSLVQRIDLKKGISTTAELSVKMFWLDDTSDLIATGYLKGKDVSVLAGFVGLDLIDYESIFVGTWYDHALDETSRMITVKVRNIMKQFEKQKLPFETFETDGTKSTIPITYDADNVVSVILNQYDRVGIRDRYIHPDYATLEAGALSGPDWNVSRVISKPTEVWKLLDELAQTAGLWLIPLGNGQILPKLWDRNEAANANLAIGNGVGDFGSVAGNLKEFFSRYYSYFNPSTGVTDPSSSDDYDSGTELINATAELKWFPEKGTKEFVDKWMVGRSVAATPLTSAPKALTELNKRWDSWFTEPLYTTKVKNLPPYFAEIEPADVIPVNGLLLPVPSEAWDIAEPYLKGDKITFGGLVWQARQDTTGEEPEEGSRYWQYTHILDTGYTDEKRFLVLAKTTNVNEATIELDIMEMPSLTRGEVTMGGYASIKIADGSTAQTGITTTPEIMTGWTVGGDASGLTPDFANSKITIDIAGAYAVNFQNSYSGSALDTMQFHLRIDSVEEDAGSHRKMGSGGDTGSLSFPDVIDLDAGDVVTVWVESDDAGGADMTPVDAQLVIFQVD